MIKTNAGLLLAVMLAPSALGANTPPTVDFVKTSMRSGTTLVDVDYRVNDPDDETVEVAVCAFKEGGMAASNFIRVSTLMEGTQVNVGPGIKTGEVHRITWDVGLDWGIDNGNFSVCVLPWDRVGFVRVDWITIPGLTASTRSIGDDQLLPMLYWFLSKGDPELSVDRNANLVYWMGYRAFSGGNLTLVGRTYLYKKLDFGFLIPEDRNRMMASGAGYMYYDYKVVKKGYRGPRLLGGTPYWIEDWQDYLGEIDSAYESQDIENVWDQHLWQSVNRNTPFISFLRSDRGLVRWYNGGPFQLLPGHWETMDYNNVISSYGGSAWSP